MTMLGIAQLQKGKRFAFEFQFLGRALRLININELHNLSSFCFLSLQSGDLVWFRSHNVSMDCCIFLFFQCIYIYIF